MKSTLKIQICLLSIGLSTTLLSACGGSDAASQVDTCPTTTFTANSKQDLINEIFANNPNQDNYNYIDTSNVTEMVNLFKDKNDFNANISCWNTGNVTNMGGMFENALTFNQPLNKWNTSKVKHMGSMFSKAKNFNQPLNQWDISKVEQTDYMFFDAERFNQNLSGWDLSDIAGMGNCPQMFGHSNGVTMSISDNHKPANIAGCVYSSQ